MSLVRSSGVGRLGRRGRAGRASPRHSPARGAPDPAPRSGAALDGFNEAKRRPGRLQAERVRFVDVAARYLVAYKVKRDGTPRPWSSLAKERTILNPLASVGRSPAQVTAPVDVRRHSCTGMDCNTNCN